MTTLYGISNCDTVKKAQRWLTSNDVEFTFHDFRKDGLSEAQLQEWVAAVGWEALLNKRSTSWRALSDEQKADLNQEKAIALMMEAPTLVRRPVLAKDGQFKTGFKDTDYQVFFNL